jgi:hypothetical protein
MIRPSQVLSRSVAATAVVAGLLSIAAPAAADGYFSYGFSSGHHYWRPHYGVGYVWGPPVVVYPYYPPRVVYYAPAPVVVAPVPANPASPVYQTGDGRYCREYQASIAVGGAVQPSYGTACLQPDGVWRIVN